MNEKVLHTLEFNKIKDRLMDCASSQEGRKLVQALLPSTDLAEIDRNLAETDAAMLRIGLYGTLSFSGVKDVRDSLKRLEIAASLSAAELLSISGVLTVAGRAKAYARDSEKAPEAPKQLPRAVRLNAHYTKNQPDPEKLREETADDALSPY